MQTRKNIRLPGYEYSTPGAYFITVCTAGKAQILGKLVGAGDHTGPHPTDPHVGADDHIGPYTQLSEIGRVVERYTKTIPGIDRYVIMPDHVHMILKVSADDTLQGPMWSSAPTNRNVIMSIRSWKTLITKELGHSIWQRSYYEHIIRNEKDYWEIVRYIEENPAKRYYCRGR